MFVLSQIWLGLIALVTAIHWILPAKMRGWWIIAATAGFILYYSPISAAILTGFTLALYGLAGKKESISGKALVTVIAAIGALLCFFKVRAGVIFDYDIEAASFGSFIIPLGLSYYALRCIHYAVEKYKGAVAPHGFGNFAQYLFFLPTLIAGPIHRFPAFKEDLDRKRWDAYLFCEGLERVIYGLVKISFIANWLINFQLEVMIMGVESSSATLAAYLTMLQMGLSIYFQFSGYSDIAIGFAMLLGFRVMENFNFPFMARNISQLWERWHISLTSWCRDYIYMGVIAVTKGAGWGRALAILTAMVVLGVWHEFSPRYLLWGFYNGMGIVIWQGFQKLKPKLPQVKSASTLKTLEYASWALTFHFFMAGLVLVRHEELSDAFAHLSKVFLFWL